MGISDQKSDQIVNRMITVLFTIIFPQVSVITKLVPSPDWFIGLDSLDLCSQGAFRQNISVEVI